LKSNTCVKSNGWPFAARLLAVVPAFCAALLVSSQPAHGFTISSFAPSVVFSGTGPADLASLDAAVGITGFVIEDFEDISLVAGLTVSGPFAFTPQSTFANAVWDGTSYYVDQTNPVGLTLDVAGGALSFGLGVGDVDANATHLYVNDLDFGSINALPNWEKLGDNVRDVYIRIDAGIGETITSVRIENLVSGDGVFVDRVAFNPVPEPGTGLLVAAGLAGLGLRRRRRA